MRKQIRGGAVDFYAYPVNMITRFSVKNYKALRDVSLELSRMNVLIGPNDSGKTSILEANAALCRSVDHPLSNALGGKWQGRELVWQTHETCVDLRVEGYDMESIEYTLRVQFDLEKRLAFALQESARFGDEHYDLSSQHGNNSWVCTTRNDHVQARLVHGLLSGVQVCRWMPRFLSLPNAPDASRRFELEPSGFGLALLLDEILSYDHRLFNRLEERFLAIFPHTEKIRLLQEPAYAAPHDFAHEVPELQRRDGKGMYFQLAGGGALVPAAQVSDGMLLILAYLAILHVPHPPRMLLIEEPENGIHPARLKEVLGILRELISEQDHTQVILTTHSPYVLDHFQPEEVTLCYKGEDGAVLTRRLSESKAVREQIDVFTLGEIWTAEGDEALLNAAEPTERAEP